MEPTFRTCSRCGASLSPDVAFCPHCGRRNKPTRVPVAQGLPSREVS
ncbi:MAG: zinc-ribbon domain-containing protein [Armatimonadetes bacterium]|nr:zinc-ribbon domain-containing protein [Armatimonadota bacterium]